MDNYFDGMYYKHQKGDKFIAFIVGKSEDGDIFQVLTESAAYDIGSAQGNIFSTDGISINIDTADLKVTGTITYNDLTPLKYDIMGPFKYIPLECHHTITSMSHTLSGGLDINGTYVDFTGGKGYIEGDRGTSFPKSYVWVQANDFAEPCSVFLSIAHIPILFYAFTGCICIVHYRGIEHRFATYLGVRVLCRTRHKLVIKQGKYMLKIDIPHAAQHPLRAPTNGKMVRTIHESPVCLARFRLYKDETLLFDLTSNSTSFEWSV